MVITDLGFINPPSYYSADYYRDYGNGFIQFINCADGCYELTTCLVAAWDATLAADSMDDLVNVLLDPCGDEFTIAYCSNLSPQNLVDAANGITKLRNALRAAVAERGGDPERFPVPGA